MNEHLQYSSAIRRSSRIYAVLLRSYPPSISAALRSDMQAVFDLWLTEVLNADGPTGLGRLWLATLLDWAVSLVAAYRDHARQSPAVRLTIFGLLATSLWIWALMAFAALGSIPVANWLDEHTRFNTALAFGAPSAAFILSWWSMPQRWMSANIWLSTQLLRISSVAASAAWALLTYLQLPRLLSGV